MKICRKCGETKPLADFNACAKSKDGRRRQCRACDRAYHKEQYAANREAELARVRAYQAAHPEEIVERRRRYYEANHARELANHQEWCRRNPGKYLEYNERRRSMQKGNGGSFTAKEWTELCEQFDNRCVRCGERLPLTVDHVVPLLKGGGNNIENIQPLCLSCNSKKHTKVMDYRIRWLVGG